MNKKLADWLYSKLEKGAKGSNKILYDNSVKEALQTLEPTGSTKKRQKEYVIGKLSLCCLTAVLGVLLSIILWIKDCSQTEIVDNRLYRNMYGDGSRQVELVAANSEKEIELSLEIEEKQYSIEELNALAEKFIPIIEEAVLGENTSLDKVEYDLNFVDSIDDFPFRVEWRTDSEYIDYSGQLLQEELASPTVVELTAVISCDSYELQHSINAYVHSRAIRSDREQQLLSSLKEIEENSREKEFMTLPSEINGNDLSWSYKKSYRGLLVLVATSIAVLLLYYSKDRDLYKQLEEREEQLRLDYPEIVSSLALLIGAGMTVPNAWNKIAMDYRLRREETGKKRFAYEEMLLSVHEMENGVIQTKAYERFGRRCRVSSYNKLSTMLSQNVKKGAANLAVLLKQEASDAFEERKHTARKLGEKAGTKLLMPMMMLLGMIMVIIMVPAFTSYF